MTTADYALIVSILSAAVSAAGFVWNVWSKFIYPKARLKVSFRVITITRAGDNPADRPVYVCCEATNFGPTELTVMTFRVIFAPTPWWRRGRHAIVNPIHDIFGNPAVGIGPFGGGLPKKLAVGESFSLYFPHNEESFARDKLRAVGLRDNFDRYHRAPNKQVRQVKADLDRAFDQAPAGG